MARWLLERVEGSQAPAAAAVSESDERCLHEHGISQSALLKFAQTFFRASYAYVAYSVLIVWQLG